MTKKKNQVTTIVNFILDKSGSMNAIKPATISGFNEYINGLKNQDGNFLFSLTLFDSMDIETRYVNKPINEIEPLTDKTYQPNAGTPLYDAVISTVEKVSAEVEKMKDEPAVLVVIMTDGEENSSTKHDEKCLKDLIHRLEHKGNFTFVYMGANQDAWANAAKFGIDAGNTYSWMSTSDGATRSFKDLSRGTQVYAASMQSNNSKGLAMASTDFASMMSGGDKDAS